VEVNEIEFDLKGGHGNNDLPKHTRMRASVSRKMLMYKEANSPKNNPVTALLSSLLGYKRFNHDYPYFRLNRVWNESDKEAQDSTVRLIQEQIPSLKGIDWAEEIYNAVKFCSPDICQLLISKNADPLTHFEGVSILVWAARRERQSFVVSQMLIEAGAVKESTENRLYYLLRETLKHFEYMEDGELLSGEASLEDAMSTGPGALVYYLLLRLPGFQLEASSSGTLLQCAAATGHYELVETLIEHGVEINHIGSYYGTALQAASRFGHVQTARILLEAGANPNICAGKHKTALRAAVLARSFQLVTLLLKSSAYDHSQDADLSIALQNALFHKDVEIALALVAAGANVQAEDKSKQPAFIHACATGHLPLINALLKAGANVNVQYHSSHWVDQKYGSSMHVAIHLEREDLVKILLANGFNLEAEFGDMDHPLIFATCSGNLVALDVLLDSSSSCFSKVLGEAIKMGIRTSNLDAMKRLVRHYKAVFDAENDSQLCFDLWEAACKSPNLEVTKMLSEWLLDCGAMPTDVIFNALKMACAKGSAPIVGILLEKLSQHGALDMVCAEILHDLPSTSAEIYELLLEYTPCTAEMFVEACIRDYPTVAKIGLGQGMRPESIDNKDRHGYLSACINGSASVVSLLLEHDGDPNLLHPVYGNPLRAAMEGCAARRLLDLSSDESLPKDAADYLKLLVMDMPPLPSSSSFFRFKARDDTFSYRMLRQYENVAEMLLSHGAKADTSAGHLGTALSLAAYMGLRKTCNSLLQNGASLAISGGFLQSPLAATITGGHSNMALAMMSLGPQGGSEGLCLACKRGNVSLVKALLESGVQPTATASDGRTALQFALEKVAASCDPWSLRRHANLSTEVLNAEMILNLLLNANGISGISDQELVAATQIEAQEIRERILEIMIPRTISPYFPEEGLIQLLQKRRYGGDNLIEQLLQHRKIKEISIRVLLAVPDRRSIRPFLAYDTRYEATLAALDAKRSNSNGKQGFGSEMTVEQLLRESITIDVSESDVLAALRLRASRFAENDQPNIVELMFDRDEKLKTTEEMLKAVQTTRDLDVLLAHTSPREGLVTSAVISAVTERNRADTEEILRKLHKYREST
jgi:ankyrin repeat protein